MERIGTIMRLPCLAVLACLLFAASALADEKSHRQAAEELLAVTDTGSIMEQVQEQVRVMYSGITKDMDIPPEKQVVTERYMSRLGDLMAEELSWEKTKDQFIELYMTVYTEDEIRELTAFYQSPVGKKLLAKMPQLVQESMRIAQEHVKNVLPKIEALSNEMVAELRVER